jgi:hypothetical protein
MNERPYEMRNITRLDQEPSPGRVSATHGWWVRFLVKGKKISDFFSDSKFNGAEKSLIAAQAYRDAIEIEVRRGRSSHHYRSKPTKRSISGIVGVNRGKSTTRRPSGKTYTYYSWQAHWPTPEGKMGYASFSVNKYGEEESLRRAIAAREAGLAAMTKKVNPVFQPPENPDIKLWRYMDFTKFVSMLENKALFFPRISDLNDPFEGSFSRGNEQFRSLIYHYKRAKVDVGKVVKKLRDWVVVSCWHMSDHESAAMWNLYSRVDESICVQTTYNRLREVLGSDSDIGIVQYIDYEMEWIPEDHPLLPFLYKRRSFEHESEIRVIINLSDVVSLDVGEIPGQPPKQGIFKSIAIGKLIEKIYTAPNSPDWFSDLVRQVSRSYGLAEIPVVKSSLDEKPFF